MPTEESLVARFEKIQKELGSPLDKDPVEYEKLFKEKTETPEMERKYLDWLKGRATKLSYLRPKEWFKKLQDVDFSNPVAATRLRRGLSYPAPVNMILAVDKEYVFVIRSNPIALDSDSKTPPQDVEIHPAFISLVSKGKWTKSSLPTFVLPVGPVRRKPKTSFGALDTNLLSKPLDDPLFTQSRKDLLNDIERDRDFEETNYFLVIDAISPEHPVWLIYDRNCLNMIGDTEPVDPRKEPVVFPEIKVNFDAAMILPTAKEWAATYSEDLEFGRLIDAINKTKINGAVTAAYAALPDVENAFMKVEKKILGAKNLEQRRSESRIAQKLSKYMRKLAM